MWLLATRISSFALVGRLWTFFYHLFSVFYQHIHRYIIKVVKDILKSFWKFVWIRVQIEFGADLDPDPHCGFETLIFTSPLVFRDAVCCYCPALRLPHRRLHQHWLHQAAADPSLQLFGFVRKEKNCLVNFRNKWHLMYIFEHFLKCKAIIFILYHYLPIFIISIFCVPTRISFQCWNRYYSPNSFKDGPVFIFYLNNCLIGSSAAQPTGRRLGKVGDHDQHLQHSQGDHQPQVETTG